MSIHTHYVYCCCGSSSENRIFPLNWWTLSFQGDKSQALLAFSFYSNGMKLLSYKKSRSPDVIQCLHGIRVISTQWVVLGHTFMTYLKLPVQNMSTVLGVNETAVQHLSLFTNFFSDFQFTKYYHNMFIVSALISVDTFFFMSGLLVSINLLKHFEKT